MEKSPGTELSDLLFGLQMTVKILDGIIMEHKDGKRDQFDYESRIHSQSNLLANNLKGIKPLVEKLFEEAYSRFTDASTICSVSKETVQSKVGEEVVTEA